MLQFEKRADSYVFIVIGVLLFILSSITLLGWFVHNESLVRVHSNFAIMNFNTAFCVWITALSFIGFFFDRLWIIRFLSLIVFILAFLTLVEYLFNTNLGVDELLWKYDLTTPMDYPGKMGLTTTVCFCLSSIGALSLTVRQQQKLIGFPILSSGFIIGISMTSLFGYLSGLSALEGWEGLATMSILTAISFLLIGTALFFSTAVRAIRIAAYITVIPIGGIIILLATTFSVYQALRARELQNTMKIASQNAEFYVQRVEQALRSDLVLLNRFAESLAASNDQSTLWNNQTPLFFTDLPLLNGLQLISSDMAVMKTALREPLLIPPKFPLLATKNSLEKGRVFLSYNEEDSLYYTYIPIFKNYQLEETLIIQLNLLKILQKAATRLDGFNYQIQVYYDNKIIFANKDLYVEKIGKPIRLMANSELLPITLQLEPTIRTLEKEASYLGLLILVGGSVTSFLSGATMFYALLLMKRRKELKRLNIAYNHAKQKAEDATKAKSLFLATMSHEIRTPINVILGSAQLLDETATDEMQKRFIERINSSSQALLHLISDILDYSKIEAGILKFEQKSCNISDLLKTIARDSSIKTKQKNLAMLLECPSQPIADVVTDPYRLTQVITNLINNATKFTEKGYILLKFDVEEKENNQILFSCSVSDTGIGIAEESQEKLFKKFSQIDASSTRRHGGVGLGLSICKKILEFMKGEITVSSKKGEGATFLVEVLFPKTLGSAPQEKWNLSGQEISIQLPFEKEAEIIAKYCRDWNMNLHDGAKLVIIDEKDQEKIDTITKESRRPILICNEEKEHGLMRPFSSEDLYKKIKESIA